MEAPVTLGLSRDLLAAPGASVAEAFEERNITCSAGAHIMQVSEQYLMSVIDGKASISDELADKLADLTSIRQSFWLNLQHNYDENLKQIKLREREALRKKRVLFSRAGTLQSCKKRYVVNHE